MGGRYAVDSQGACSQINMHWQQYGEQPRFSHLAVGISIPIVCIAEEYDALGRKEREGCRKCSPMRCLHEVLNTLAGLGIA